MFLDMMIIFESVFLLSLIFNFLTPFIPEGDHCPTKDHGMIALNYIKGDFIIDFIPLIPV